MDKRTYYVMTFIIAVLCVTIGVLIGTNYIGRKNEKPLSPTPNVVEPNNDTTNPATEPTEDILTYADLKGVYQYDYKQDGQDRYYIITLYDNGTYSKGTDGCGHTTGKYTIDGNKIKLEDVIYYECDACFHRKGSYRFNDSIKTYDAILNDNSITIDTFEYKKLSSNPGETPTHIIDPVDDGEFYIDCTNLKNK